MASLRWIRLSVKDDLPIVPAVYVVIHDNELGKRPLYVGQTKNLRTRFRPHHLPFQQMYGPISVAFRVCPSIADRLTLEQKLIDRLRPIGNTVRNTHRRGGECQRIA